MMRRAVALLLALPLLMALTASLALAGDFERDFTFDSHDLKVVNMIGAVTVTATEGEDFQVHVVVRGADAGPDVLTFVTPNDDGDVLAIQYPLKEHQRYVYPEMGSRSKTTMHFSNEAEESKSWLKKVFAGMSGTGVTVRGKGNGLEVWADLTIAVPRGASLEVRNGVGEIQAADLAADLSLDVNSGAIAVRGLAGDLLADTGSGRVLARGITGELDLDTGSGEVELSDCDGSTIKVDTGSGKVVAENVQCRTLDVDTGSGSVKASRIQADEVKIDTGSGSVVLQLDRMGRGDFLIDTGSGGIDLILPGDVSAHITAETGSGSVECDLAEAKVMRKDRSELEVVAGSGAAKVTLGAGSGTISIRAK